MTQPVDVVSVGIQYDTSGSTAQLQRAVDSAMASIRREFEQAFGLIEREAVDTGQTVARTFGTNGELAEGSIREIGRQASTTFDKVSRDANKASVDIATKLGGALKLIGGIGAATALTAGFVTLTKLGLSSAASLEQTQISFNALLGSVEKGTEVFKELQQFAARTPFEFPEVANAAKRFLAFNDAIGISDDKLEDFLTTVGDLTSVTGTGAEGMNRIVLALGQIASKGKVSLEELMQIGEAVPGFSPLAAIAEQLGVSTAKASEMISKGTVDATTGVQALLKGMQEFPGAAGAMEKQAQTLLGVFSTFKDTVGQALAGAFAPIIPDLKSTLTEITPILGSALSQLAPSLGGVLTDVIGALVPLIMPLAGILTSVVEALRPFIQMLGPILQPILEALQTPFNLLAGILIQLAPTILQVLQAVLPLVPSLGQLLSVVLQLAVPFITLLGFIVEFATNKALAPLLKVIANSFEGLSVALQHVADFVLAINWESVGQAISDFFSMIGDAIGDAIDWFTRLPGLVWDAMKQLPGIIWRSLTVAGDFLRTLPGRIIGTVARLIKDAIMALINTDWSAVLASIGDFLLKAIELFLGFVNDVIKAVVIDLPIAIGKGAAALAEGFATWIVDAAKWLKDLPGKIIGWVGKGIELLAGWGADVVRGIWEGIKGLGGWLYRNIKDFVRDNIVQGFKSFLGISSPSTVMAEEVGAWIPPGIEQGINDTAMDLTSVVRALTTPFSDTGASRSVALGPGAIVLNFYGGTPTVEQARAVGEAAGRGIVAALEAQSINQAVRAI